MVRLCILPKKIFLDTNNLVSIFAEISTIINKVKVMAYKISEDCAACGTCIDECPVGAISAGDIFSIDPKKCEDCGTCEEICPVGAISKA